MEAKDNVRAAITDLKMWMGDEVKIAIYLAGRLSSDAGCAKFARKLTK
jgi:hypothetical protein